MEGVLTLLHKNQEYTLYPGDSAHYLSTERHNWVAALDEKSPLARWLLAAAARYLGRETDAQKRPLDAVARFHLGNGARVERINWLDDLFLFLSIFFLNALLTQ